MLMYPFRTLGRTVAATLLNGPEGQARDGPTTAPHRRPRPGAPMGRVLPPARGLTLIDKPVDKVRLCEFRVKGLNYRGT